MAEYAAMPLWTDAYLGDTTHLTTIEHGAYLLLLMAMWRADGDLPNDDRLLARYARLTPGQWKRIKPVLMPFFKVGEVNITQGRLTDELNAVRQQSRRQSDKAKARWLKNKDVGDATAMPEGCQSDASHTHTANTDTNVSGAAAPPSPDKVMFDSGKRLLVEAGKTQAQAGQLLGKWRKAHGTEAVIAALGRAQREAAIDPVSFIEGCFKFQKRKSQPQVGDVRVTPSGERQEFIGGDAGWVRAYE